MADGLDTLTDKEKETLRLMVRGHDAKSMARELSLSVHTIHERLRATRRKLGVTSSREAARLLFESENGPPQNFVHKAMRGDAPPRQSDTVPTTKPIPERTVLIGGTLVMLTSALILGLLISDHPATERPIGDHATAFEQVQLDTLEQDARDWLALVDAYEWERSFAAAGRPFRDPNTIDMWRDASLKVRVPLGPVVARTTQTVELVGAASGEDESKDQVIVRFLTDFAKQSDVAETVTLEQEHGEWRVMGYIIDTP